MKCKIPLASALGLALMGTSAHAGFIVTNAGTDTGGGNGNLANYGGAVGYVFTPKTGTNDLVTQLGIYDSPSTNSTDTEGDGIQDSQSIGMWKVNQFAGGGFGNPASTIISATLIATATINSTNQGPAVATGSPTTDLFRFVTPAFQNGFTGLLVPGTFYALASTSDAQDEYRNPSVNATFNTTDFQTIDAHYSSTTSGLALPDHFATYFGATNYAYIGPNLEEVAVPEPASLGLLAAGAVGLLRRRRV